eukprot:1035647-Pleurochrysis_carterae.AAC.1
MGVALGAASVCPARLPPMELAPLWAHGVHCRRPLPDFNDYKYWSRGDTKSSLGCLAKRMQFRNDF